MGLLLKDGSELEYQGYQMESNSFLLHRGENEEVLFPYSLEYMNDYSDSDYIVYLLAKDNVAENDIYQLYDKKEREDDLRVGWIFPIQALLSLSHKYATNEHFLKYASVAFSLLCGGIKDVFTKAPPYITNRTYSLTDFYSEESIICIVSKERMKQREIEFSQYLPGLFEYGYFFQTTRDPGDISPLTIPDKKHNQERLSLKRVSSHLLDESFINSLLTELIPYEKSPVASFFFQYQLVELLMEKIWLSKLQTLAGELGHHSDDLFFVKNLFERVNEITSEKNRIGLLFSDSLSTSIDTAELFKNCNSFLSGNGVKIPQNISVSLYMV